MKRRSIIAIAVCAAIVSGASLASSHREAPALTKTPKVDATDFYMFRSYEPGREGYVTLIANYQPFQDGFGGPNFYLMDEDAMYAMHIDNDGDALPDLSFYFRFYNRYRDMTVSAGGIDVAVPLSNTGPFGSSPDQAGNLNVYETYVMVASREGGEPVVATNLDNPNNDNLFVKPFDYIGTKSQAHYDGYANRRIWNVAVDGCAGTGRVFVGQRKDSFSVNVGEIFDLVHTNPVGSRSGEHNDLANKNVTTIALELPIACLTAGSPIIGAWTAAYSQKGDHMSQVSRLSAPLVNEVVIGLPDKDGFNASLPVDDGQYAKYVTNPSLPILLQSLFGVKAPTKYPRTDMVAAFLTGIDGLNQPTNVHAAEMMRLNTSIAPRAAASQNNLGVLGGDNAGFPNGRRPGDDVVDIELRVAMGVLLPEADAPDGQLPYTDGAIVSGTDFRTTFPYLNTPVPGATDD
jgi:hypothetical protein